VLANLRFVFLKLKNFYSDPKYLAARLNWPCPGTI
jgi:hypothetical protein